MYDALNGYYSLGSSESPITNAQLTSMGYTNEQIMMLHRLVRNQGKPLEYFIPRMIPAANWGNMNPYPPFGWPRR